MSSRTCMRCYYWRGDQKRAQADSREIGTCLVNPPTVTIDPSSRMNRSMRAESSAGSVCKEWTHMNAFNASYEGELF